MESAFIGGVACIQGNGSLRMGNVLDISQVKESVEIRVKPILRWTLSQEWEWRLERSNYVIAVRLPIGHRFSVLVGNGPMGIIKCEWAYGHDIVLYAKGVLSLPQPLIL